MSAQEDVPSPIDLRSIADARAWVLDTVARRPDRPFFFEAVAEAINSHFEQAIAILELGSGPGHLASVLLSTCKVADYQALDFSDAMHLLAKEHLGKLCDQVTFVTADLRSKWQTETPLVDAIVTTQAAHEVRHKRHQPTLIAKARAVLKPNGLLLFCDHYFEVGSTKHPDLYFTRDEQPQLLSDAGFREVRRLVDRGGMALYRCMV